MPITFAEKAKRQKNLIFVFVGVVLITFLTLYFGYFKKEKVRPIETSPVILPVERKKIEIDFEIFKNPILKEFQLFEKIEPIKPEEIGRENPFLPY